MTDARRSGNPATRAAGAQEDDDVAVDAPVRGASLRDEAAGDLIEFEFDGDVWVIADDFIAMDFYEQAEAGRNVAALRIALGQKQYIEARRILRSGEDIRGMMNAVAEAIGGGSMGESRASRRSSARRRPPRR